MSASFEITAEPVSSSAAYTDEAVPPEFDTTYLQIGAEVIDAASAEKYGPRKPPTYASPYIETRTQCVRVAEEIIKESNKVWRISFSFPLNPMVKRGQTARIVNDVLAMDFTDTIRDVRHFFNLRTGEATTEVSMRAAEYVFEGSLAENQ